MTRYAVRLYSEDGLQIHDTTIDCNPKHIPDMVAGTVARYLKDSPYPGTIQAQVSTGQHYRIDLILLKNDFLDVYRHACHADRDEVQE